MVKSFVRYERDGDSLWALWENEEGDRWYEAVILNGEVQF